MWFIEKNSNQITSVHLHKTNIKLILIIFNMYAKILIVLGEKKPATINWNKYHLITLINNNFTTTLLLIKWLARI